MAVGLPSQGLVRYYLSSGQNEVAEYDGVGQRLRYYVHGPMYIDERVVMHNDPVAGGAATTGSDYIYLLKDLCTVAGMADERGWPVERYDYDAYGKVYMERVRVLPWAADFDGDGDVDSDDLAVLHAAYRGSGQEPNGVRGWRADLDGDGDVDGSDYALFADAYRGSGIAPGGGLSLRSASMVVSRIGNSYFFTGRRLDVIDIQTAGTPHHFTDDYAGLQVYDYRRRTYDPELGRFWQRDPLLVVGQSPYQYVNARPLVHTDPSGLKEEDDAWEWYRLDLPPTPWKCARVDAILDSYASAWDKILLDKWLGKSYTNRISMSDATIMDLFDPSHSVRNEHYEMVNVATERLMKRVKCGGTESVTTNPDEKIATTADYMSRINMISHFRFWSTCTLTVSKTCVNGCCRRYDTSVKCDFHAWDYIDFFATGDRTFGFAGFRIADRLYRACHLGGQGFVLRADTSETRSSSVPCSGKSD